MTETPNSSTWRDDIRPRLSRLRTRRRRQRLLRAYAGVCTAKTGKHAGFTPTMAAYDRAEQDGVLSVEDGDVVWHWPEHSETA